MNGSEGVVFIQLLGGMIMNSDVFSNYVKLMSEHNVVAHVNIL